MTFLRRTGGSHPYLTRLVDAAILVLLWNGLLLPSGAAVPPYKIEVRITEEPSLQLLDNQGKIYCNLPMETVRRRVTVQDSSLLASFGRDSQHHFIIMLGLDMNANASTAFLFGENVIAASPEAIITLQLLSDHLNARVSPGLMGKIWVNGTLLSRGETRNLQFSSLPPSSRSTTPSPDQPRPSMKDFQSIPPPSI